MKRTETIRRWERKPGWAGALEVAGSSLFLFYSQQETSAVLSIVPRGWFWFLGSDKAQSSLHPACPVRSREILKLLPFWSLGVFAVLLALSLLVLYIQFLLLRPAAWPAWTQADTPREHLFCRMLRVYGAMQPQDSHRKLLMINLCVNLAGSVIS